MKYLVVGLGNVGREYELTRHNLGRRAVVAAARAVGAPDFRLERRSSSLVTTGQVAGHGVVFMLPETMMNNSGAAVSSYVDYEVPRERLVVVYDDVALPLGVTRISFDRGDGGHNGVASIAERAGGADFIRVRLGVGPVAPGRDLSEFVLERFTPTEEEALPALIAQAGAALVSIVGDGLAAAMNEWNSR